MFRGNKDKVVQNQSDELVLAPDDAAPAYELDPSSMGLKILQPGTNPTIEYISHWQIDVPVKASNSISIVAIHGLNGHREKTWTSKNNVLWLRDLLPQILPNARIMTWGYDSRTHARNPISSQHLHDHADTLVSDLWLEREMTSVGVPARINTFHSKATDRITDTKETHHLCCT